LRDADHTILELGGAARCSILGLLCSCALLLTAGALSQAAVAAPLADPFDPTPTAVTLPAATGPVTQIAEGSDFSLAVTSTGQLYAFGDNAVGELGSAFNSATLEPNPTPTLVTLPGAIGPVIGVAAGQAHSLAVTSSGQLYAFGFNDAGQLGSALNNGTRVPNPAPALVTLPGATGPVTQVAGGWNDTLAVTSTGQLYAFGANDAGQLGSAVNSGAETPNPTPTLVTLPGASGRVTQVAAGEAFTLVVTSTGQLYAFGSNYFGELGSTLNNGNFRPNPTPELVTLPGAAGPVTQVAAGWSHSLVVTSTGQLYAFGSNYFGELGSTLNNRTNVANPTPALVTLPLATGRVTQVAAGWADSLAVTSTGNLYAFGGNSSGELGSTADSTPNPTPALVSLPSPTDPVTHVAAGFATTLMVTSAGQLYAFGLNRFGQLGSPPEETAPEPMERTTTAPTLTSVSLTNRRFRVARQATAISAKRTPLGSTFRFTPSETVSLKVRITRTAAGLSHRHTCLAPSAKLRRAHAGRCTRRIAVGSLTRTSEPMGADSLPFSGRIGRRALSPGTYEALLSATGATGQSEPATLRFTIVR
jgi:alpha-tubulin suppressor-like RCC1 family protein